MYEFLLEFFQRFLMEYWAFHIQIYSSRLFHANRDLQVFSVGAEYTKWMVQYTFSCTF